MTGLAGHQREWQRRGSSTGPGRGPEGLPGRTGMMLHSSWGCSRAVARHRTAAMTAWLTGKHPSILCAESTRVCMLVLGLAKEYLRAGFKQVLAADIAFELTAEVAVRVGQSRQ